MKRLLQRSSTFPLPPFRVCGASSHVRGTYSPGGDVALAPTVVYAAHVSTMTGTDISCYPSAGHRSDCLCNSAAHYVRCAVHEAPFR